MTGEPHVRTPAHDACRATAFPLMTQPANDEAERNRQAEMRLLLQRTLDWLRSKPHG